MTPSRRGNDRSGSDFRSRSACCRRSGGRVASAPLTRDERRVLVRAVLPQEVTGINEVALALGQPLVEKLAVARWHRCVSPAGDNLLRSPAGPTACESHPSSRAQVAAGAVLPRYPCAGPPTRVMIRFHRAGRNVDLLKPRRVIRANLVEDHRQIFGRPLLSDFSVREAVDVNRGEQRPCPLPRPARCSNRYAAAHWPVAGSGRRASERAPVALRRALRFDQALVVPDGGTCMWRALPPRQRLCKAERSWSVAARLSWSPGQL